MAWCDCTSPVPVAGLEERHKCLCFKSVLFCLYTGKARFPCSVDLVSSPGPQPCEAPSERTSPPWSVSITPCKFLELKLSCWIRCHLSESSTGIFHMVPSSSISGSLWSRDQETTWLSRSQEARSMPQTSTSAMRTDKVLKRAGSRSVWV